MGAVEQLESIAKQAWETHPTSQPLAFGDEIAAYIVGEELIQALIKHPSPRPQILDEIFVGRNENPAVNPETVNVEFFGKTANKLIPGGAVDYISYETHPEWIHVAGAADKRWLVVQGIYVDDQKGWAEKGKKWAIEYVFENYSIRKQEKARDGLGWKVTNENALLQQSDLVMIGNVFSALQDKVIPELVKST